MLEYRPQQQSDFSMPQVPRDLERPIIEMTLEELQAFAHRAGTRYEDLGRHREVLHDLALRGGAYGEATGLSGLPPDFHRRALSALPLSNSSWQGLLQILRAQSSVEQRDEDLAQVFAEASGFRLGATCGTSFSGSSTEPADVFLVFGNLYTSEVVRPHSVHRQLCAEFDGRMAGCEDLMARVAASTRTGGLCIQVGLPQHMEEVVRRHGFSVVSRVEICRQPYDNVIFFRRMP